MPRPFERIARCSGYAQPRTCRLAAGRRVAARASLRGPSGRRTCIRIREATASGVVGTRASCLKTSGQWQRIGTTYNIRTRGQARRLCRVDARVGKAAPRRRPTFPAQTPLRLLGCVHGWARHVLPLLRRYMGRCSVGFQDLEAVRVQRGQAGVDRALGTTPPWGLKNFPGYEDTFNLVRRAGELNAVSMSTGNVPLRDIATGSTTCRFEPGPKAPPRGGIHFSFFWMSK